MTWLAATRLDPDAAVGYYGGHISQFVQENPRCAVMLHFGTLDKHIPKEDIDRVQAAHLDVEIFWYEADNGFNCDARASYNAEAAKQARVRTAPCSERSFLAAVQSYDIGDSGYH